jgi:predicted nucleic acid-binding protein
MGRIPKLFLETTIFNFYYDGKQGQKRKDTLALFDEIKKGSYKAFTSEAVIEELRKTKKEKFDKMSDLTVEYSIPILVSDESAIALAKKYIKNGIIPPEYPDDALHIAVATVKEIDFILSWNMGHIVKQKTMIGTGFIAIDENRPHVLLCTPSEALEYDEGRKNCRAEK